MLFRSEVMLHRFIISYRDEAGGLSYRTVSDQLKVIGQVLARLEEEGLEGTSRYSEIKGVRGRVFGASMFINQFMQDIFKAEMDEDSWEKASW